MIESHSRPLHTRRPVASAAALVVMLVVALSSSAAQAAPPDHAPTVAPAPLVVGTHPFAPFVMHAADGSWTGISMELWKRVADQLHVAYVVREVSIADLLEPSAHGLDVVVSLPVTARNYAAMDLTLPFYSTGCAIATRQDPLDALSAIAAKLRSPAFLKALGILLVVIVLMGFVVWRVERHAKPEEFGGHPLRALGHGAFWAVESLVGKASGLSKTWRGRLLALAWSFASVAVVSGVTAKLASELTVSQLRTSVTGLGDLPRVRVGSLEHSLSRAYLDARHIDSVAYADMESALAALARGDLDAVVNEAPVLQHLVRALHDDRVTVLPGTFQNHGYAFGVARPSADLTARANTAMLTIVEADDWKKLVETYIGKASE